MLLAAENLQAMISAQSPLRILVLCTGNSARSIMAEALFNHYGAGRIRAYSAGSRPVGQVNPFALEQVASLDLPDFQPSSQSWDDYTGAEAPPLDLVLTVCSNAACETSPDFPGTPERIHWGLPDPAAVQGAASARRDAFAACFGELERRIKTLIAPLDSGIGREEAKNRMREIGAQASVS